MRRSRVSALDRVANAQSELEDANTKLLELKREVDYIEDESGHLLVLIGVHLDDTARELLMSLTEAAREIRKIVG